jgi:hypothetical protein
LFGQLIRAVNKTKQAGIEQPGRKGTFKNRGEIFAVLSEEREKE